MNEPLVTVVCLCYNHERFLKEAIQSVQGQSYQNIEIVVVDDFSTDESRRLISELAEHDRSIKCLFLERNHGNCAAFNKGLAVASGEFVVDFSTDDVMMPERIQKQVEWFKALGPSYGVVFTDVLYIDAAGKSLFTHYEYLLRKGLLTRIPAGDVYKEILQTYFVSAPSMLVRKEVFDQLNGYDEALAYEDFDFWVRSSRYFKYGFLNEVLTKVRKSAGSLSTRSYLPGNRQLHSTYLVCRKARQLNRSSADHLALVNRVRYEFRHAVLTENYKEARLFLDLLKELTTLNVVDRVASSLLALRFPTAWVRRWYHRARYR